MCGIYGLAARAGVIDERAVGRNRDALIHRGPDSAGAWFSPDGRTALAHRRLAIIDLSPGGHQPMVSDDGTLAVAFNGEIYNYRSLRDELKALGFSFRTDSDTEVLMQAYRAWGEECLERLNGMFAFAIYDSRVTQGASSIFIARDRAGEKPFYYALGDHLFEFASELKALSHRSEIDLQALNHYFSLGYIPGDLCLIKGVKKLPPGYSGRYDLHSGILKLTSYWQLPANRPDSNMSGEEFAAAAGDLLVDSVRTRLVADVPVGVLLSGGLDSSLITAAAARSGGSTVETFTISLPGSSLDEARHAEKVARHFGARHHLMPLDKPSIGLIDGLAPLIDEPIADSSILPAWLVFGLARKRVTVALGGDGGDELFGGYLEYTTSMLDAQRLACVPAALLRIGAKAAAQLPAGVKGRNKLASLKEGAFQQSIWGGAYFDVTLRQRLFHPDVLRELGAGLSGPELFLLELFQAGSDPIDAMTRTHFGSILPDDFLVKVDRASMAHSLEVRAPFLDHRLIEFAFGKVPSHWKVGGGESRRLQRMLARAWLPRDLDINRKQGFSIPINEWLREEGEAGLMARMDGLPDLINMKEVRSLIRGHLAGRANGGRLFSLIMLAIAMRNLHS